MPPGSACSTCRTYRTASPSACRCCIRPSSSLNWRNGTRCGASLARSRCCTGCRAANSALTRMRLRWPLQPARRHRPGAVAQLPQQIWHRAEPGAADRRRPWHVRKGGWSQGDVQEDDFTDIDATVPAGLSLAGTRWGRPDDTVGLAAVVNEISATVKSVSRGGRPRRHHRRWCDCSSPARSRSSRLITASPLSVSLRSRRTTNSSTTRPTTINGDPYRCSAYGFMRSFEPHPICVGQPIRARQSHRLPLPKPPIMLWHLTRP